MSKSDNDICRTLHYKGWITYRVVDTSTRCIGDVYYGEILVLDIDYGMIERIVYKNIINDDENKIILRIITEYNDGIIKTDEFRIIDMYKCERIIRNNILLDINNDYNNNDYIIKLPLNTGWISYKIRDDMKYNYKIGDVIDDDIIIIKDSDDKKILYRSVYKTRNGIINKLLKLCLGIHYNNNNNNVIIRIYTYYNIGQRIFDEYIKVTNNDNNNINYIELIRKPIILNLSNYKSHNNIEKYYINNNNTIAFRINKSYKNQFRIGKVMNGQIIIVNDNNNIRLRFVYVDIHHSVNFNKVQVKTCHKIGECIKSIYQLIDGKYIKISSINDKFTKFKDASNSIPNILESNEDLYGSNVLKSILNGDGISSEGTSNTPLEVQSTPAEVTTSFRPAVSSFNYLPVAGSATPRDRGEDGVMGERGDKRQEIKSMIFHPKLHV